MVKLFRPLERDEKTYLLTHHWIMRVIILLLFLVVATTLFGQKKEQEKQDLKSITEQYSTKADSLYTVQDYGLALPLYLKIDSIAKENRFEDFNTIKALIKRAEISRLTFTKESTNLAYALVKDALSRAKVINSQEGIHYAYVHLADLAQLKKNYKETKEYIDLAFKYYLRTKNDKNVSRLYLLSSAYYLGVDSITKADESRLAAVKYLEDKGNDYEMAKAKYYYGHFLRYNRKNPKKAIKYLEDSMILHEKVNKNEDEIYHRCLRDLAICYDILGQHEKSKDYFKLAYNLNIKLNRKANRNTSRRLETRYQTEKKEQEIALLKSQNELAEQRQRSQRNLLLGGIGLTSLAGLFLFVLYRNRQRTNKNLRELDAAKSNFFANISHELRTPLTLIKGPLESQLENAHLSSMEKQNLTIAKNNTERLETLVNQLLDLSKLESGFYKLNVSKGNLSNFLKSISESFSYKAQQKKQQLNSIISISDNDYWFDTDVLQKVVSNILGNAVKYSPEKAKIKLQATVEHNRLALTIKNTGASLSNEELSQLFNRFHRGNENQPGTGIGLALTKELVELHKGSIQVKSEVDSVTFLVKLPVGEAAFEASEKLVTTQNEGHIKPLLSYNMPSDIEEPKDTSPDGVQPIILVVDDNTDVRTYISSLFKGSFQITTAENGKTGFQSALEQVPDLIITDLMMPEDDGLKLTENCKTHNATSHIPIVMLTAKAGDENRLQGLETGADAYLTKPFNNKILKQTVNNLLESRKKLQERFSREVILSPKEISIDSYDERFLNALQDILDNQLVESDFNVEAFSKALGMSRMQLHRKLKALTGQTTTEFIRSQRLKLAADLLKKSDANVSEIGYSVGFNNHSHFTKCFKEQFGVSPSEYSAS